MSSIYFGNLSRTVPSMAGPAIGEDSASVSSGGGGQLTGTSDSSTPSLSYSSLEAVSASHPLQIGGNQWASALSQSYGTPGPIGGQPSGDRNMGTFRARAAAGADDRRSETEREGESGEWELPPSTPLTYVNFDTSRGMEQVFFRLHTRFVSTVTKYIGPKFRRAMEYSVLLFALLSVLLVAYLHLSFISPLGSPGCLGPALQSNLSSSRSSDPLTAHILEIRIDGRFSRVATDLSKRMLGQRGEVTPGNGGTRGEAGPLTVNDGTWILYSILRSFVEALEWARSPAAFGSVSRRLPCNDGESQTQPQKEEERKCTKCTDYGWGDLGQSLQNMAEKKAVCPSAAGLHENLVDLLISRPTYLFSLEKSYLVMRETLRASHGVTTKKITLRSDQHCIGGPFLQILLENVIGYDTIIVNNLIHLYGGRGFLYNAVSKELISLNYASEFRASTASGETFFVFKLGVLITTLFLFFTITTLISFTLRETQERMLKFTFLLQHHVRNRLPYGPLIFTHVVESLVFVPIVVGILFFLFEFFNDQLLAFMVLSLVWLCELFSVVSVRTRTSVRFFPRAMFYYFSLFHIYFFSFPFGFSYLVLISTVLFLFHSMMFFWNRHEVPALQSGRVSIDQPREIGSLTYGRPPNVASFSSPPVRGEGDAVPTADRGRSSSTISSSITSSRQRTSSIETTRTTSPFRAVQRQAQDEDSGRREESALEAVFALSRRRLLQSQTEENLHLEDRDRNT